MHKYPELVATVFSKIPTNTSSPPPCDTLQMLDFISKNKNLVCKYIIDGENEQSLFKEILMPMVYEKHMNSFLDFSCGLVGSLCISQRDIQDILRNTWGKKITEVLGFNIFPPKDVVVK
jgi:hypothetical protein